MEIIVFMLVSMLCWVWLWFMIKRSAKWERLVDRENGFWISKGVAVAFFEKLKRFEKGPGQRLLVGSAAILAMIAALLNLLLLILRK